MGGGMGSVASEETLDAVEGIATVGIGIHELINHALQIWGEFVLDEADHDLDRLAAFELIEVELFHQFLFEVVHRIGGR